jgi:thioredoxin reductase
MKDSLDVAVIGGGPAGLAAAIAVAREKGRVTLFDEWPAPGGRSRFESAGAGDELKPVIELAESLGVQIRTGHRVWSLFADGQLGVAAGDQAFTIRASRTLLATGSTDRSLPFPGGSLPGVFTGRALLILLHRCHILPGRRFAIVAGDADAKKLALAIALAGGTVVVTVPPSTPDISAHGDRGVTSFTAMGVTHEVDIVVVDIGLNADWTLAQMAECAAAYSPQFGCFIPVVDERMQTTVPGLYAAGSCLGPDPTFVSYMEGLYAGKCVAQSLGLIARDAVERVRELYLNASGERQQTRATLRAAFTQAEVVAMTRVPYE